MFFFRLSILKKIINDLKYLFVDLIFDIISKLILLFCEFNLQNLCVLTGKNVALLPRLKMLLLVKGRFTSTITIRKSSTSWSLLKLLKIRLSFREKEKLNLKKDTNRLIFTEICVLKQLRN